ncbi:MAG: hydrogenase [Oscillospiraceae bacterium]|jgi:nitrogenase molybdenum-iron protein beta chain|nr:hydrogenase [Oscillospiraceae bacterium]
MRGYIEQPRFSCALAAQQTVLAIPRAVPIAHCGPGCVGKTFAFSGLGAGHQGEGYAGGGNVTCTNTNEQDVVFGGEEKLTKFINGALKVIKSDLYVVLAGCTAGIIGDDVLQVSQDFAEEGKPVVGVDTSGFRGNSYVGHELVVKEIIKQFVDDFDLEVEVRKGLVNVFASVPPQNPFWRGDLEEIKRILELLGLEVNILFGTESAGVSEWKDIPNAQFNLVLNTWVGESTAKLLKTKYGTPYLHIPYLPTGAAATSRVIREIGAFAELDSAKVEKLIDKEEKRFYTYFTALADFFADFRNSIPYELYLVADSSYAIGVSDFVVNELGFTPEGIYITDPPSDKVGNQILEIFKGLGEEFEGKVVIEDDGGLIQEDIRKRLNGSKKAAIFGSLWEDMLADETGNLHYHISIPMLNDVVINRSYVGYNGGLRLIEEIYSGIFRNRDVAGTTLVE